MRQFDKEYPTMEVIINTLHKNNAFLAHDWLSGVKSRHDRKRLTNETLDWPSIIGANIDAIIDADGLIVENSHFNYSSAYQTAIALQHNKPVLNLYRIDSHEYKEWPDKFFVSGIDNPLFQNTPYTSDKELPQIVEKFLHKIAPKAYTINVKLTLDREAYERLEGYSKKENVAIEHTIEQILNQKR
jgi:hypothetical protein